MRKVWRNRKIALWLAVFALVATTFGSWANPGVSSAATAAVPAQTFRFDGGGWGHGVGMSQYGAYGMARNGASAGQILAKYYQGTELRQLPQPEVRIWITEVAGPAGVTLTGAGHVDYQSQDGTVVAHSNPLEQVILKLVNGGWVANQAGTDRPLPGTLNVAAIMNGTPLLIGNVGTRYRFGRVELLALPSGAIRVVVSQMSMDQYLLGLGEVPSSWPVEVLKAQAIAARSYALDKVNRLGTNRPSCSCSLYGTVADQNYEGYDKEAAFAGDRWVAAVQGTAGVVATYNGAPIQAYYSSSSGGYTENSEDGFSAYLPYLRATPDPDDEVSPNFHWTQNYTTDELTSWFGAAADTAVGVVRRIELLEPFNASGRVGRVVDADHGGVRIVGSTGTKRVSGQRLQTVINRGVYAGGFGYARELRSNLFRVSGGGFDAYDPRFGGGVFVATGPVSGGTGVVVTGAGAGGGPHVRVLEESGVERAWFAYDPRFAGGVTVAACDLDGDGRSEIVTGAGPGGGPHVQVFRADGTPMAGWFAYPPTFVGGVYVACGDVDGDGQAEVVTGAGPGGVPLVAVFRPDGRPVNSFLAYDVRFGGGVRVAVGDLDGPGGQPPRIVTGAGRGGGAHIAVYRGDGGLVNHFFALPAPFASGVYVAVGDTNGDGTAEIIAGSGESGEPRVLVFDRNGTKLSDQLVGANSAALGARVAAGAPAGILGIVVGAGPGGRPLVSYLQT